MKRGLTTLMTVAIALISVQAMGRAPMIGDIPSPIIGNSTGTSQATRYVYADAFDLNKLVTDDATADADLKWSYEIVGTAKYTINGNASLAGTDNPVAPPAAKMIAGPGALQNQMAGATAAAGEDGNANTITIRNINLFPYGGTASTNQAANVVGFADHAQVVTFWCSDGELASMKDVIFYTDNQYTANQPSGWNRLSGGYIPVGTEIKHDAQPQGWTKGGLFNVTTSTYKGKGLCLNVALTGANFGEYRSVQPYFSLTDNTVYCIRVTMNCTQASPGQTPFWDFILENFNGNAATGMNLYAMDAFFMDNEGGANGVISSDFGTELKIYWAPAAYQTAQWKSTTTGLYAPGRAATKDPCLRFRVMDVDTPGLANHLKSGGICLQSVVVEAIPTSAMTVLGNVYAVGTGAPAPAIAEAPASGSGGNMLAAGLLGAICNFSGGTLTVSPLGQGATAELVTIRPATDRTDGPLTNATAILDDYPITWDSDTLYKLEVELSAPDANSEAHPFDVMWLTMESPTNEVVTESLITATAGTPPLVGGPAATASIAMPKVGTPQKYAMFHYSGTETWSALPQLHRLRWRLRFGNAGGTNNPLNFPLPTDTTNTGSVRVHSVRVDKVTFE